jgi:hypothetical protein
MKMSIHELIKNTIINHHTVELAWISSACAWLSVMPKESMCPLLCFRGSLVVLHVPHMAVSPPSPYSFKGSRMRVIEGGTPLVFFWSRSAVFSLSQGSSQKAAGIISSGLLHVRNA